MNDNHYEMKFCIHHFGCYSDNFNTLFPGVSVQCFNMQFIGKDAVDLFHFFNTNSLSQSIVNYLKKHKSVKKVQVLEERDGDLYLKIISRRVGKVKTISEVVFTNNCYYLKPLTYENNCEVWIIGSSSKENLTKVVEQAQKEGEVKIVYIKKGVFKDFLTKQERRAIMAAHVLGYYYWPRKTDVRKIAAQLHISKTALLSALRRAEAKIITWSI
ncbi:HTH DNA binding domain protein [Candidatus Bilamarchaeum dharawalense]|uniref:HTH DNA binding domain protein n=1 Tax=Candidatus Bilamarchaeum dharawalense TaxID=2885759 RepID=A0A5E4LPQ9_9ARCH|nr:HTH DNA binding domain protein [Candidatus Bilamarchaeum dharawalense]